MGLFARKITSLFILSVIWLSASSFSYDKSLTMVEDTVSRYPETALKIIDDIEGHAKVEHNDNCLLQCIMSRYIAEQIKSGDCYNYFYGYHLDPKVTTKTIKQLQNFRQSHKQKPTLVAVANYFEASVLKSFADSKKFYNSNLLDSIPENIDEWTPNIFKDRIEVLLNKAFNDASIRIQQASKYSELINLKSDGRIYLPTVFDLMVYDCLRKFSNYLTPTQKYDLYDKWKSAHKNDKDPSAYIYASVAAIEYKYGKRNDTDFDNVLSTIAELRPLLASYSQYPASLHICNSLADAYMGKYLNSSDYSLKALALDSINYICQTGMDRFPNAPHVSELQCHIDKLHEQSYYVRNEDYNIRSGEKIRIKVSYANVSELNMTLYRFTDSNSNWIALRSGYLSGVYKRNKVRDFSFKLNPSHYLLTKDTIIELDGQKLGGYILFCGEDSVIFDVSNLYAVIGEVASDDSIPMIVVDSKTGKPQEKVTYSSWFLSNSQLYSFISNRNGFAKYPVYGEDYMYGQLVDSTGRDRLYIGNRWLSSNNYSNNVGYEASLFTDRSVYRPGQKVYFKLIKYYIAGRDSQHVQTAKNVHVRIFDSNRTEIYNNTLQTNEYGSASDSVYIPVSAKLGEYTIQYDGDSHFFQVEEYKRPTFEVTMDKPKEAAGFGQPLTVTGKAEYLNATPVQAAQVRYTITRKSNSSPYFWRFRRDTWISEKVLATDTVVTADDGSFHVSFTPLMAERHAGESVIYTYEVKAVVTDANGESHEMTMDFNVANWRMTVAMPLDAQMTFDQLQKVRCRVVNINGEGQMQDVNYHIYCNNKLVASGVVASDEKGYFKLPEKTDTWPSGEYSFKLDVAGDTVTCLGHSFKTVLYRITDHCPPINSSLWISDNARWHYVNKLEADTFSVCVGTSLQNAYLIMLKRYDGGDYKEQCYHLSNSMKKVTFHLGSHHQMRVDFILVHDGEMEHKSFTLQEEIDKTIHVTLSVFRDKVETGARETWKISVPKDQLKKLGIRPKNLELMATMYDASLDFIKPNSWSFHPQFKEWYSGQHWRTSHFYLSFSYYDKQTCRTPYVLSLNTWKKDLERKERISVTPVAVEEEDIEDNMVYMKVDKKNSIPSAKLEKPEEKDEQPLEQDENQPKVRSNFVETAFFYPNIYFDGKGNAEFSFTMPDQMTRWKFMALVHSQSALGGKLTRRIVSQKEFTIVPNYPRFLRHGDTCTFTAKITNLDSVSHSGQAKLQFRDFLADTVIMERVVDFDVIARQNKTVAWNMAVPENADVVVMRVIAVSGTFSDAEQKMLPILSNRMTLTQTLPMFVRGGQTKEYTLNNLATNNSTTLKSRFLRLEMTPNPVWSCVKCLPHMATQQVYSSIGHSAKLYAMGLSEKIMQNNPTIFKVIEQWKAERTNNKASLLSNLNKNEEVKNILLNESPWVLDAKDETEHYEHLDALLNVYELNKRISEELKILEDYHAGSGGYYWVCSFYQPSFYPTLFILDNYIRLIKAGVNIGDVKNHLPLDVEFLDNEQSYWYGKMKLYGTLKDYKITTTDLYYLQVRTAFSQYNKSAYQVSKKNREAYNFFMQKARQQWPECSLYGKALGAIALEQDNNHADALEIVNSLREFSETTDEMGMYWPSNHSTWLWEDDAINTHTRIMEALQMVSPNSKEQDEMKVWLINQKRTQDWGNVIATIEALNVMLMDGKTLEVPNRVTVQLGNQTITPANLEAGTGNYSQTIEGMSVTPDMAHVKLTSAAGGNISFGGLYWQFEEEIDKIKFNQTGLAVEKTVTLQTVENDIEGIKPVTGNTLLKVGDKLVIRLVVNADRDYEYVCLKDQRASCLEPLQQISKWDWSQGVGYWQMPRDAAMYYFFDHLPKGTYVFEYPVYVTHEGNYSNGITNIQCLYAPEFSSNTGSVRLNVGKR